jgi:hypothetical protein
VNDENAAPVVAADSSEASESSDTAGEESSSDDASESKGTDTPTDTGVAWVKVTEETSAEADADSS